MDFINEATIGENTLVFGLLTFVLSNKLTIGKECIIMDGVVMMGAGGITIGDNWR